MTSKYRTAYASLGEERMQKVKTMSTKLDEKTGKGEMNLSEADQYWLTHRDRQWSEIPGKYKTIRRTRQRIFCESITQILMQLEPVSYFNPVELWKREKADEESKKKQKEEEESDKKKKNVTVTKAEQIRLDNIAEKNAIRFKNEVTLIRNSKKNLIGLVRSLKFPHSRAILLVQILKSAFDEYEKKGTKKGLYEVLWAIEALDELPEVDAPQPIKASDITERGDSSLVYDSFSNVAKLLKKARKVMTAEKDLIKMQLIEMSDCLPPLSKLNFGFKLDEWQKQALRWIDQGESVVICAPTSSGKTVLSAYVSVIFKSGTVIKPEIEDAKASGAAAAADESKAPADEDDENEEIDEEDVIEEMTPEEEAQYQQAEEQLNAMVEDLNIDAIPDWDDARSLIDEDRKRRAQFKELKKTLPADVEYASGSGQKVLFVVPTEPLVWQVAAYFTKLLKEEGDRQTRVALVTDQLTFSPAKRLNIMPQIVVGTPQALESALTKPRGLFGPFEANRKAAGDQIPGGFDHFDWVIYDEVHALDGAEGAALQRLIRAMSCSFLALSATIGNAEELKRWLETVRGDQFPTQVNAITAGATGSVANTPIPTDVNLLVRQVRFINLQRYLWSPNAAPGQNKLQAVGPLAAVQSVAHLEQGILSNSSLSFTSNDLYRLWEEMEKVFPKEAIQSLSPYTFFGAQERITLGRTKEYEDLVKAGLIELARNYPQQCQKLLDVFSIENRVKECDLCDVVETLAAKEMLPCLAFHLNTFDAIKLFQQLLAGLEYRQKTAIPTYYTDAVEDAAKKRAQNDKIIQSCGGNEEELQEKMKAGDIQQITAVDPTAPHSDFCFSKSIPMVDHELDKLLQEMERHDGFEKRHDAGSAKTRNETILKHALIRGLRRGIGLFIEEVSFPSYRRAIQKLASTGKLGVVVSDGSLAFGVNMPFRTCVFCGEMRGELDELMAQQMSGRAGRRGLDTQGNIVYAGIRSSTMRRLMIGSVCNITGEFRNPRYDSLILQPILSPRHTGFARAHVIAGKTLYESVKNIDAPESYIIEHSKRIMTDLGFIAPCSSKQTYIPNEDAGSNYGLLSMIWELRQYSHESITIGMLMSKLIEEFGPFVDSLRLTEKSKNAEIMEVKLNEFFAILVQLVGRTAWKPSTNPNTPDPIKLLDLPFFANPQRRELYDRWATIFQAQQDDIPEEFVHLRDPVPPGTELDGTFFQCAIDRNFVYTLDEVRKQQIKKQIWHVGTVLKTMNNSAIMEDDYTRVSFFVFRDAFEKLRYLNSELIREIINFQDVSSYDLERRTDTSSSVIKLKEAAVWSDLEYGSWHQAIQKAVQEATVLKDGLIAKDSVATQKLDDIVFGYIALKKSDSELVRALVTLNVKAADHKNVVVNAVQKCSFYQHFAKEKQELAKIGVLMWLCTVVQPTLLPRIVLYLQAMFEDDLLSEETCKTWFTMSSIDLLAFLPTSYSQTHIVAGQPDASIETSSLTEAQMKSCKDKAEPFIKWLDEAEEDDDDEDDDEEED